VLHKLSTHRQVGEKGGYTLGIPSYLPHTVLLFFFFFKEGS
jgi:hypothetical protein